MRGISSHSSLLCGAEISDTLVSSEKPEHILVKGVPVMRSEHRDLLDALKRQYRTLRGLYLACLIAAVLALIAFFIDKRLSLVFVAASLIGHLAVVRPKSKAYERAFLHACGQCTLDRHLDGAAHTEAPTLNADDLRKARLVAANADKGGVLIREGGAGTHSGRAVRLGDVVFAHSFPTMEGKTQHEFISGTWVTAELGRDTGLDWRLLSPKVMMNQGRAQFLSEHRDLRRVESEGPKWLESGGYAAFRPVGTPDWPEAPFLSALKALDKNTDLPLAVCVAGNQLHVLVVNRILGQKVSSRIPPSDAVAQIDFLPELDGILAAADALAN